MSLAGMLVQPLTIAVITIGAVGALAIVYVLKRDDVGTSSAKKQLLLFRPGFRAVEIPIEKESTNKIDLKKFEGITRHFIKNGRSWTLPKSTLFIGVEGSAYTSKIVDTAETKITLSEALRMLWGDPTYDNMPTELKEALDKHKFGVTIAPDRIDISSDGMPPLSSEDINELDDQSMLKELAKATREKGKTDWMQIILGFLAGAFLVYLAANMHWLKVATA